MYAKVTICLLVSLCMSRAYVIIGSHLYNTAPSLPYIPPSAATPSQQYVQSHQDYVQAPVAAPVKTVSKLTYEVPLADKDEHSDEVVIAGPSGVIKTHRKSSKPVLAKHTTKYTTKNFVEPQIQLQLQPQPQPQPQQEVVAQPQPEPQPQPETQPQPQLQYQPQPQPQPQPEPQPQPQLQYQPQPQQQPQFQPQPELPVQTQTQSEQQPITYFTSPVVRIEHDQIPNDFAYNNADFNPEAFLLSV